MPKKYKPFDVMKQTGARERLGRGLPIIYGPVGPPRREMEPDDQVAWLDLVVAAPPGRLERHHWMFLEITAGLLSRVRRGEGGKGIAKLLGKSLRDMGLTPGTEPTPAALLERFKGKGTVQ